LIITLVLPRALVSFIVQEQFSTCVSDYKSSHEFVFRACNWTQHGCDICNFYMHFVLLYLDSFFLSPTLLVQRIFIALFLTVVEKAREVQNSNRDALIMIIPSSNQSAISFIEILDRNVSWLLSRSQL